MTISRTKVRRRTSADFVIPKHIQGTILTSLNEAIDCVVTGPEGTPSWFKKQYQLDVMYSKYVGESTAPAEKRKSAAIEKWLAAERGNARTNLRLFEAQALDPDFGWTTWYELSSTARSLIRRVLGPVPELGVIPTEVTNGASVRIKRSPASRIRKLMGVLDVSSHAANHLRASYPWLYYISCGEDTSYVWTPTESSVMFTVPKNSDIDRVACKEPEGNMLLQRAIGLYIRKRLRRRCGINLQDQSRNRALARQGSVDGSLATIDLSSASDTITQQLVLQLLPHDWWSLLDDLRVHSTLIDGELHHLQMFSSMGNGFTFELESLIFWALTRAVQDLSGVQGIVSTYGDDIICSSKIGRRLQRIFSFCGLKMNPTKSYWNTPFRESCGGHYYGGFDVTPFYVRKDVTTLSELMILLNQVLEWDGRDWGFFLTPELAHWHARWTRSLVPQQLRGASSPDATDAVVTGHRPTHRLVRVLREVPSSDLGEGKFALFRLSSDGYSVDHWELLRQYAEGSQRVRNVTPTKEISARVVRVGAWEDSTTWSPYLISGVDLPEKSQVRPMLR